MAAQVPLAPTNPKELLMRAATVGHQNWENQRGQRGWQIYGNLWKCPEHPGKELGVKKKKGHLHNVIFASMQHETTLPGIM